LVPLTATTARRARGGEAPRYVLDDQVGFILRQVNQRHTTIFARHIPEELTPTQWAAMSKLLETGPCSQNLLGRRTAMDAATIKGVVDRLAKRGLMETRADQEHPRQLVVALTEPGRELALRAIPIALAITEETLAPLSAPERATLLALLRRLT
jgi:MarR family transcriptional regulator, lower aerobic nicotinate degradation pathway regulator